MSTRGYAVRDSGTMLRRNLLHAKRYPVSTTGTLVVPILLLLAFAGLFGNALGAGLGVISNGAIGYTDYLTPSVIVIAAASGALSTALSVNLDMTAGIINRFRTMAISRAAVLTGHVLGSMIQTIIAIVLVIGVALLIGFRPNATAVEWLAAAGLLALLTLALTWPAAAAGQAAKGPEGASNVQLLAFLPILGSGVVPPESMPAGVRWFAEHQPFTPIIETLRGLLLGTPIGNNAIVALAWCVGIALIGYLWARALFRREPSSSSREVFSAVQ
jgi:ABC-2 type transport system permease protein